VPPGDLIGYLGSVLEVPKGPEQIGIVAENPVSILTSVFVLNMASIKAIPDAPIQAPAQSAGSHDLTYDQLLDIVFKINIWICCNRQGFFNDAQKVTLLKLAMSNL